MDQFPEFLQQFLEPGNGLPLAVGILIGLGVVALMRASQVWNHRGAYGYDIYTADSLRRRFGRLATFVLAGGLIAALGYVLFWPKDTSSDTLASFSTSPELASEQAPQEILEGMTLFVPKLALNTPITHAPIVSGEWDISLLRGEAAHLAGTVYPGQDGNAVLAGHVTVPGAGWGPFRELDTLQPGDEIFVQRGGTEAYTYIVAETFVVDPSDVHVAYPTSDSRLTLITCTEYDRATETYAKRIVVVAYLFPNQT